MSAGIFFPSLEAEVMVSLTTAPPNVDWQLLPSALQMANKAAGGPQVSVFMGAFIFILYAHNYRWIHGHYCLSGALLAVCSD